jgi:hypothetical protein
MRSEQERMFDGPIPGENYTSDTRNYPWHRPPDLTDYDEIVEAMLLSISNEYVLPAIMGALAMGASVSGVTDYLILSHVGKGKFSIDMGLLAAGPVARFIQIMADDFGVEYEMGVERDFSPISPKMAKLITKGIADEEAPEMGMAPVEEPMPAEESFMTPPSDMAPIDEQEAMLGYTEQPMTDDQPVDAENMNGEL